MIVVAVHQDVTVHQDVAVHQDAPYGCFLIRAPSASAGWSLRNPSLALGALIPPSAVADVDHPGRFFGSQRRPSPINRRFSFGIGDFGDETEFGETVNKGFTHGDRCRTLMAVG